MFSYVDRKQQWGTSIGELCGGQYDQGVQPKVPCGCKASQPVL